MTDLAKLVTRLEWVQKDKQPAHAVSTIGTYLLSKDFDGWYWMRTSGGQLVDMCASPFPDEHAAKAAAQADYEARILATLNTAALQGLVEAVEGRLRSGHDGQCPAISYRINTCTCLHDHLAAALARLKGTTA